MSAVRGVPDGTYLQDGTSVYGLSLYHLFRLAIISYAIAHFVIACLCGLKGLMSCKAMTWSFLLCVVFALVWGWSVLFVPLMSENRSLFTIQRLSYQLDNRLYVIHASDTGSGPVVYTLFDCDRFELVCVKLGEEASDNLYDRPPTLNIDRQQRIIQVMNDGAIEVDFPLPDRSR